jgi:hypothetical protein
MSSQRQHSSMLGREERYFPVLSAGGLEWDLSNLCDDNTLHHLRQESFEQSQSVRSSRSEAPLYPSIQEGASIPDINIPDAFEKAAEERVRWGRDPSRHTTSLLLNPGSALNTQLSESQIPDAIQFSEATATSIPRVTRVDECRFLHMHHYLASSPSRTKVVEASNNNNIDNVSPSIPIMMESTNDSSQRKTRSVVEDRKVVHMDHRPASPRVVDASNSDNDISPIKSPYDSSSQRNTTLERLQVQISPGEYMPLRGAQETLEAIHNGSSRIVDCVGCQSVLQCVHDCQLVICPDCKLVSPVTNQEEESCNHPGDRAKQLEYSGIPRCPTIWQDDEEKEYRSDAACSNSRDSSVHFPVGGLGLGMKIVCR